MSDTRELLQDPSFLQDLADPTKSSRSIATEWGCGKTFVQKWRQFQSDGKEISIQTAEAGEGSKTTTEESSDGKRLAIEERDKPITLEDARIWIRSSGDDPEDFHYSARSTAYGNGLWSNKMSAWPKFRKGVTTATGETQAPLWPVISPAESVTVAVPDYLHVLADRPDGLKLSAKCADTQIGFRVLSDGTLDPFHDDAAMALFVEVCRVKQPDTIKILGDFLDLPSQGRFNQEAAFARTTQLALNRGHRWLAELRAVCPNAEIILIEGNHDKRMQTFVEANALAAFGLTQANALPEEWPVMSIPFLLRLEDLDIEYVDSYPAATSWDNDLTRNIHGTRANSKGSTMGQYIHELPHVNTWAGHTHRVEIVYRTVLGARGEPIESYAANPGCLCRTDGGVPSVKGAIGASGAPAKVVEDWQSGFGLLYYNETESWPSVYRIKNGTTILDGHLISVV